MKVLIFARLTYAVFFNRLLTKLPFGNIHAWCTKLPSCQTATFVQRTSDLQVLPESDRVLSFHHYLLAESLGRPKAAVDGDKLEYLNSLHFTWRDISAILGVSVKTLQRRAKEWNITTYSTLIQTNLLCARSTL